MLGQMGHFVKYAPEKIEYGINRYTTEAKRLCSVLEKQLETNEYVVGNEYTIADMAIFPWIRCVEVSYGNWSDLGSYPNIELWKAKIAKRPAVIRGLEVNKL